MPGERFDGGVLVWKSGRNLSSEPIREFAGQADHLGRTEAITGEGFADVYLAGLNSQKLGQSQDQPGLDGFRGPEIGRRNSLVTFALLGGIPFDGFWRRAVSSILRHRAGPTGWRGYRSGSSLDTGCAEPCRLESSAGSPP